MYIGKSLVFSSAWVIFGYINLNSFSFDDKFDVFHSIISNINTSTSIYPLLIKRKHHWNPHKIITFWTGGQIPSKHYTNRNNHIYSPRLVKHSVFHIDWEKTWISAMTLFRICSESMSSTYSNDSMHWTKDMNLQSCCDIVLVQLWRSKWHVL
jgi:hypothetical protein